MFVKENPDRKKKVMVAVFLELVVLLKPARMSLWFVILLSLRGRE